MSTLNLGYISTKPGQYKAASLVFGLFSLAFTAAAYNQSLYFNGCSSTAANTHSSIPCGVGEAGTSERCEHIVYQVQRQKIFYRSNFHTILPNERKQMEYGFTQLPSSCPSTLLVSAAITLLILVWLTSFIMFIIQLVVDLNLRSRHFWIIDCLGHFIASFLLLLSTLYLFAFLLWLWIEKYPCTQEIYDELRSGGGKVPSDYQAFFLDNLVWIWKEWIIVNSNDEPVLMLRRFPPKDCEQDTEETYKIGYLSAGTVFTATTSVFYGMTVKTLKKHGGKVAPDSETPEMEAMPVEEDEPVEVEAPQT